MSRTSTTSTIRDQRWESGCAPEVLLGCNHVQPHSARAILIPELHALRPPEQAGGYCGMRELTRLWLSIRRNADVRSFLRLRCVSFTSLSVSIAVIQLTCPAIRRTILGAASLGRRGVTRTCCRPNARQRQFDVTASRHPERSPANARAMMPARQSSGSRLTTMCRRLTRRLWVFSGFNVAGLK